MKRLLTSAAVIASLLPTAIRAEFPGHCTAPVPPCPQPCQTAFRGVIVPMQVCCEPSDTHRNACSLKEKLSFLTPKLPCGPVCRPLMPPVCVSPCASPCQTQYQSVCQTPCQSVCQTPNPCYCQPACRKEKDCWLPSFFKKKDRQPSSVCMTADPCGSFGSFAMASGQPQGCIVPQYAFGTSNCGPAQYCSPQSCSTQYCLPQHCLPQCAVPVPCQVMVPQTVMTQQTVMVPRTVMVPQTVYGYGTSGSAIVGMTSFGGSEILPVPAEGGPSTALGDLDNRLNQLDQRVDELAARVQRHDERLRKLEGR